jgi:phosphoribosylaminoimidazolecarboxamide formyltransferase/IMP cyclohydrolase
MAERKVRRALVSVSDKTGVVEFVKGLVALGVEILSTGGTARTLREAGLAVKDVSEYTGFPEIMDGRVKTLHPKVHGALLAVRNNPAHQKAMAALDIQPIDMVVVNLYPFEQTVARPECTIAEAVENIDIGGPSMLRSAAKNNAYVAVVSNPARYGEVLAELQAKSGALSDETRFALAAEAFATTARYDAAIARYFAAERGVEFPDTLALSFAKLTGLRYGENPHQRAACYREVRGEKVGVPWAVAVSGSKELSYNNILDADAAWRLAREFAGARQPDAGAAAVIIKHTNPCGCGVGETLRDAYVRAYLGDPLSAFGGILAVNRPLDRVTAEEVVERREFLAGFRGGGEPPASFLEVIIAPDYEAGTLEVLQGARWGKSVRILKEDHPVEPGQPAFEWEYRRVAGGLLVQSGDNSLWEEGALKVVTKRAPTDEEMQALRFAWVVAKHTKSNAIVLASADTVVGVGAGQMSRIDAFFIACRKAAGREKGAVLASDAFFPYQDVVEGAAAAGVTAIIEPGGAMRDDLSIEAADAHGIAMVFTGQRHFRH